MNCLMTASLCALQRYVFVRRSVDETLDQAESRLLDAGPDPADERQLPDRHIHRLFVEQLLHLAQDRSALVPIELNRLLRKQLVDVRVAAVGIIAALHHELLQPGRRIAECATGALDDVLELLVGIALEERRTFQRTQLRPDTDLAEV